MIRKLVPAVAVACALAFPALADDDAEEMASAEELAMVNEAIAKFNCGPVEAAEKETADLFELDDAPCQAGQYDIKLDGAYTVISMTYDGPVDE